MPHSLDERLAALDRPQLVELVKRLVSRHPDLEELVHLPLAGEGRRADAAFVQTHVRRILMEMGDDWRASWRAQFEIFPMVQIGEDYEKAGALSDARVVYRAIIDAILPVYEQIRDEESEIGNVVGDCVAALGRCLSRATEPELRQKLLADVFYVFRWDSIEQGSYGMDEPPRKVILEQATEAERRLVVTWLREALPTGDSQSLRWRRQQAGRLMLELSGDDLDPREHEAIVAATNLTGSHVDLLLEQGRIDEAIGLLSSADTNLVALAERLLVTGREQEIVAKVARHPRVFDVRATAVRKWLSQHGIETADLERLSWQMDRFGMHPTITTWKKIREEATRLGRWPEVAALLAPGVDRESSHVQPVRSRALAAVGRLTEAMAVFATLPESAKTTARLEIARDAEQIDSSIAKQLYEEAIERLRARGTRSALKEARELRQRVDELPLAGGDPPP